MSAVPGGQYSSIPMQSDAEATGVGTAVTPISTSDYASTILAVQIAGITTATITFQGTIDGTNWVDIQFENLNDGTEATTATGNGIYRAVVSGLVQVRANITSYTSGTINVTGVLVA